MSATSPFARLARASVLSRLPEEDFPRVAALLEEVRFAKGDLLLREGDHGNDMFFVLDGEAIARRGGLIIETVRAGDHVGDLAILAGSPRAASVEALTDLRAARLSRETFDALAARDPALALRVTRALVSRIGGRLTTVTDGLGALLAEHSLPRQATVRATVEGHVREVPTGTPLSALLPSSVDGKPVVAALLGRKAVSMGTLLTSSASVEPLTTAHWEGDRIFRRSIGLLLLAAADRIDGRTRVKLGPSIALAQAIDTEGIPPEKLPEFAAHLETEMRSLSAQGTVLRREWWTVDEAADYFERVGDLDAARLLHTWRDATVPVVACEQTPVLGTLGPLCPTTSCLGGYSVRASDGELLLVFGGQDPRLAAEEVALARAQEKWLKALSITSVGAFNDACVRGDVAHVIQVCEGYHEKRISAIADAIAARRDRVRAIAIAGPSSSGKTTFIKRLSVQLQVNGLRPVPISLDDYYVDREKTVRGDDGDYDFEALEAIDLALLQDHLHRLLAGEKVRTARFDFVAGKSHPDGGPELSLGAGDLLLMEGIHGLNPKLVGNAVAADQMFRVFLNPLTSLAFDRLSRVSLSDVRLLRRIVRDRRRRGLSAAENIRRWPSVRAGERRHVFPFVGCADESFDSTLVYEMAVVKVFAERYLLEVPQDHPSWTTAHRLRQLVDRYVTIYPEQVPPTSILREFIGGSGFEY